MKQTMAKVLNALLGAETIEDVNGIIESLSSEIKWVPFGGTTGNKGQIKISTDPVRAIVERLTNAIDAVVERGIQVAGIPDTTKMSKEEREKFGLNSPQEAIKRYVPGNGDAYNYISLTVTPKGKWDFSLVDTFDRGIGIRPEMMPHTILSLSGSNKVSKPYQAGMYGQGGASSIGRVQQEGYVIMVSRAREFDSNQLSPRVGFTVIRYEKPTHADKRGHYSYFVNLDGTMMSADVPFDGDDKFEPGKAALVTPTKGKNFPQGTLVRHVGYDLSSYRQQARNPMSLTRGLNTYMFDTLLPFRFFQPESGGKAHHPRIVEGARRMLDNLKHRVEWGTKEPIPITIGKGLGSVDLEYWVIEPPTAKGAGASVQPGDFVHPNRPVVFTLNGQTHGEYSLYEVGTKIKGKLPYSSNSLVMHVALDNLTSPALDNLLSSGREDLVTGKVWDTIRGEVETLVVEDTHLEDLDIKRMELSLASGASEFSEDKMLKDSIAQVVEKMSGDSITRIFGGTQPPPPPPTGGGAIHRTPKVLPTLKTSNTPTFIKFVDEEDVVFNPGKRKVLHLETDANDSFVKKIKVDAGKLEVRWVLLEGGRVRISIQCPDDVKTGGGRITVSLGKLHASVGYCVERKAHAAAAGAGADGKAKKEADAKKTEGRRGIPKWDVQWTKPGDFNWVSVLSLKDTDPSTFAFDYRIKQGAGILLYCSEVFPAFARQIAAINGNPGRSAIFKKHYIAQALIHAFKGADESGPSATQFAYVDETAKKAIEMEERVCAATSFAVTAMRMLEEEVKKAKSGAIAA